MLVGRLFRWTTEGQCGSGDVGVALASEGFVSPPGSLVMSPLPHGTSEGVDADRCAFDQFEEVSLAAHWTRLRPSGPRCSADQPAPRRRESVTFRHFGAAANRGRNKLSEINLRLGAPRTTGSPP